jgi:ketosteroid isomerase-like protein
VATRDSRSSETRAAEASVVRALFAAWRAGDAETADRLIADGFVFTSPQDTRIDRVDYFRRCFPTSHRFVAHTLLQVVPVGDGDVFAMYEYELADGSRYRNCEVLTVRSGQVTEVQVFFGGRVPNT